MPDLAALLNAFLLTFSQDQRSLRLRFADASGLADDLLLPQRLEAAEALSACYRCELHCLSTDAFLELKDLIGQPAAIALKFADGSWHELAGVVTAARQLGSDGGFACYGLTL
ncbi:Phage late control gene D protein (GPD), partial [Noviherbaspirillum humi]